MTRIEAARHRLRIARYAIAASALGLFAVLGAAVRASHPATHAGSPSSAATSAAAATSSDDSFFSGGDDGGYSVGPAGSAQPSIQSSGS
jgi:hypothetical protein